MRLFPPAILLRIDNNMKLFIIIFLEDILFMCKTNFLTEDLPEKIIDETNIVFAVNALSISF